jgi:hypothetical protein
MATVSTVAGVAEANIAKVSGVAAASVGKIAGVDLTPPPIPMQITGLKVWLDPTVGVLKTISGSVAAADGETVERWEDQSGQGNHVDQATSGSRPVYHTNIVNSLPAVQFDGSTPTHLKNTGLSLTQPNTIFAVAYSNSIANSRWITDGTGAARNILGHHTQKWIAYSTSFLGNTAASTMTWVYLTGLFNGASSKMRASGAESTGNPGVTALTDLFVGAEQGLTPGVSWQGYIAELLIYNSALSATDITTIETYLATKYGL